MKKFLLAAGWVLFAMALHAQETTILYFDWESSDPKVAAVGPNASSIGSKITTKLRIGSTTNRGLTPPAGADATTKQDIFMTVPVTAAFNVAGIDLSFDYQRDETTATIIERGTFRMGFDGMNIRYRVSDGAGGATTVTSPTFVIPDDDTYRSYRFRYDPVTGVGILSQNGTELWRNATATPGRPLYWTGDGNIVIGTVMDGSGKGNAVMDNMRFVEVPAAAALPVELTRFTATVSDRQVKLDWETATEVNHETFIVERSSGQSDWEAVATVAGSGDADLPRTYRVTDALPLPGRSYYRLRQVDHDGSTEFSDIREVNLTAASAGLSAYPNPSSDRVILEADTPLAGIRVFDSGGREVTDRVTVSRLSLGKVELGLANLPRGAYRIIQSEAAIMVYRD